MRSVKPFNLAQQTRKNEIIKIITIKNLYFTAMHEN